MTDDEEENAVRQLGELIGYGRTMQLCEQIWSAKGGINSGVAHSVGPCVAFMVPCPHPELDDNGHCDWCCGSGRVTDRVLKAMPWKVAA